MSAPSKPCDRIPSPKAMKSMRTLKMKSSKTTLDSPNQTQRVPAMNCSSFLADLKIDGKLSAKDVCCITFYARASGCKGTAVLLAMRPNAPPGHHNRLFRKALGLGKTLQGGYDLKLPGHDKLVGGTTLAVPTLLAHDELAREVAADPSLERRLRESLAEREWAHDYLRLLVVVAASPCERVWPLALYLDSVPFLKQDGLLGLTKCNLCSGETHPLLVVQRSRHDDTPSTTEDGDRLQRAGQASMRGVVAKMKGDWAECVHTLGLQSWSHLFHPCFKCHASRERSAMQIWDCTRMLRPLQPTTMMRARSVRYGWSYQTRGRTHFSSAC